MATNELDVPRTPQIPDPGGYRASLGGGGAASSRALNGSLFVASQRDPDRWAKVTDLATRLKMKPDFVDQNYDLLRDRDTQSTAQYTLASAHPTVQDWFKNPDNATIGQNEVPALHHASTAASWLGRLGELAGGPVSPAAINFESNAITTAAGRSAPIEAGSAHLASSISTLGVMYGLQDKREAAIQNAKLNAQAKQLSDAAPSYVGDYNRATSAAEAGIGGSEYRSLITSSKDLADGKILAALKDFAAGQGGSVMHTLDLIGAAISHPKGFGYSQLEGLPSFAPALALGAAGGAVANVPGAAVGTFVGFAPGSVGSEFNDLLGKTTDPTTGQPYDITDATSLERAYNDPALMAKAVGMATRYGLTSSAVMALVSSFGGRIAGTATGDLAGKAAGDAALAAGAAPGIAEGEALAAKVAARSGPLTRGAAHLAEVGYQAASVGVGDLAGQVAEDPTKTPDFGRSVGASFGAFGFGFAHELGSAIGGFGREVLHPDPIEAAKELTAQTADAVRQGRSIQVLANLGDAIRTAEVTGRVPSAVKDLIETASGGKDATNLYFQPGEWDRITQAAGLSPSEFAGQLTGDEGRGYHEAVANGTPLVIPIADFVSQVAPDKDLYQAFTTIARTEPDGLTLSEAQKQLDATPGLLKTLHDEAQKAETDRVEMSLKEPNVFQRVYDKVTGKEVDPVVELGRKYYSTLKESGKLPDREARRVSALIAANVSTLAHDTGMTLEQADAEAGMTFARGVTGEGLNQSYGGSKVRTPEFDRWFGDSKVVDEKGEPLVVYKGTNPNGEDGTQRTVFPVHETPSFFPKFGDTEGSISVAGFFGDSETASKFSGNTKPGAVFPAYLSLSNPLVIDANGRTSTTVQHGESGIEFRNAVNSGEYDGAIIRNTADEGTVYVAFHPEQIKSATGNRGTFDPNDANILHQNDGDGPRASYNPETHLITFLANADRSSVIHELGHRFLFSMVAAAEKSPRIAANLEAARRWLGNDGGEFTREQHEQFARGFEAYLMEGRSPSEALRNVFYDFKRWMTKIYSSILSLGVQLTPEIRQVYDRMLATDEAIAKERYAQGVDPLFGAESLPPDKRERYGAAMEAAQSATDAELNARAMKSIVQEESREWASKRKVVAERAAADVSADPAQQALAFLSRGAKPDGSPLDADTPTFKLDRASIVAQYGETELERMPAGTVADGGFSPDQAAPMWSYEDGLELIRAIQGAEPFGQAVDRLTDQRMQEQYGERMTDAEVEQAAGEIVRANDDQEKLLRMDLEALASKDLPALKGLVNEITKRPIPDAVVKDNASRIIGATEISKVKPYIYQRAAQQHANDARAALLKGDVVAAFDAKEKEILTTALYRDAVDAARYVDKSLAGFKRYFKSDEKQSKSRDMDLVNVARAVVSSFGIGNIDKPPIDYLEAMKAYDPQTYEMVQPLVADAVRFAKHYSNLTVNEFLDMRDAAEGIYALSRATKLVTIDGQKMTRAIAQDAMIAQARSLTKRNVEQYAQTLSDVQKAGVGLDGLTSLLRRVEHWVTAMDAGNPDEPLRKYLFNTLKEQIDHYRVRYEEEIVKYGEIAKTLDGELGRKPIVAHELVDDRPESANYGKAHRFRNTAELLSALLNRGNDSNFSKLLRGYGWGRVDPETGVLDSSRWDAFEKRMWAEGVLRQVHYDYAQGVWGLFEAMKPELQRAHKAIYGHYFAEVTANTFHTPFGEYEGGYYPAKVDPFLSDDAKMRDAKALIEGEDHSRMLPSTGRGATKARVEAYAGPLILDQNLVPSHISWAMRFAHIEPTVREVGRMVNNRDFRAALAGLDQTTVDGMLLPWLRRAASQLMDTPTKHRTLDKVFRGLRSRTVDQTMAFNVLTSLGQFHGVSAAVLRVDPTSITTGAKYMKNALWRFVRDPSGVAETIDEKSKMMRKESTTAMIEARRSIDTIMLDPGIIQKSREWVSTHGYFLARAINHTVKQVTWTAAYDAAQSGGMDEKLSVRHADRVVREVLGSTSPEDVAAYEAGSPFVRNFTVYSSFYNNLANLNATEFQLIARQELGLAKSAGRGFSAYVLAFMIPAVFYGALRQVASGKPLDRDGDGREIDDVLRIFFSSQWDLASRMLPGVGTLADVAVNRFDSNPTNDDIKDSPVRDNVTNALHAPGDVYNDWNAGKLHDATIRDVLTLMSYLTRFPLTPLAKPLIYQHDKQTRRARPSSGFDLTRGYLTGSPGGRQ